MILKIKLVLWISVGFHLIQLCAQSNEFKLTVVPVCGLDTIIFEESKTTEINGKLVQIDVLRFYISNIRLLKKGEVVFSEKESFHLLDATVPKSLHIAINKNSDIAFDAVKFDLGIDSTTNVSGVMGGDLDPTKGMYWTWQSGYINFKLEGTHPDCNTRNKEFQFHLGGYAAPNYCLQTVQFSVKNPSELIIHLDILSIFSQIDVGNTNHIMSPSQEALAMSKVLANSFKIGSR